LPTGTPLQTTNTYFMLLQILKQLAAAFSINLLWYLFFSVPAFLLFWVLFKKKYYRLRIQKLQKIHWPDVWHDVQLSLYTLAVFAIMRTCTTQLSDNGVSYIYTNTKQYGYLWLVVSFIAVLIIDDAFYYWSHRLMHHPKLYKFLHKAHHNSTNPTPLCSFALHPFEAVIDNALRIIIPLLLPMHLYVFILWQLASMLNNILGHLGHEAYPRW
jgi:sterol desaturase/sphingolipid hydroxylase (fatty acid hydroxylase superfamily)